MQELAARCGCGSSEQIGAVARGRRRTARSYSKLAAPASAHRCWVATMVSFGAIGVHERSGSKRVIAAASSAVLSPRSRCHTIPS